MPETLDARVDAALAEGEVEGAVEAVECEGAERLSVEETVLLDAVGEEGTAEPGAFAGAPLGIDTDTAGGLITGGPMGMPCLLHGRRIEWEGAAWCGGGRETAGELGTANVGVAMTDMVVMRKRWKEMRSFPACAVAVFLCDVCAFQDDGCDGSST